MPEMPKFSREQFSKERFKSALEGFLKNNVDIRDKSIRDQITQRILEETDKREYFDEEEFSKIIENAVENLPENQKNKFFEEKENERKINSRLSGILEDYYRKSPEKKGINFRDQIKDSGELRAWLYLTLKDETERNRFKGDFERALSQKEPIYFRLWPPSIVNGFKYLLLGEAKPKGFSEGEFSKEFRSYIEDLQRGKDRITFWFEQNLLPEELKNRSEDELRNLGIEKKGNIYEFYLEPDKISDFIINFVGTYTETIKKETELEKLFKETIDLYKEVSRKIPKELRFVIAQYGSLIMGLKETYKNMIESGASSEEYRKIEDSLKAIKNSLEELKKDIESGKKPSEIKSKISNWFKEKGSIILSGIGLWGLAVGWFLPLYIIARMYEFIAKEPLMKK